jgi:uncharacterized UBP type Zn finger protein
MAQICGHLKNLRTLNREAVHPSNSGCKECLESGDSWVHLRLCLECGHVGCCDDSPNRHATAHFHKTKHPVIKSFEPGEEWAWCFVDEAAVEAIPTYPEESPRRHYSPSPVLP